MYCTSPSKPHCQQVISGWKELDQLSFRASAEAAMTYSSSTTPQTMQFSWVFNGGCVFVLLLAHHMTSLPENTEIDLTTTKNGDGGHDVVVTCWAIAAGMTFWEASLWACKPIMELMLNSKVAQKCNKTRARIRRSPIERGEELQYCSTWRQLWPYLVEEAGRFYWGLLHTSTRSTLYPAPRRKVVIEF